MDTISYLKNTYTNVVKRLCSTLWNTIIYQNHNIFCRLCNCNVGTVANRYARELYNFAT